MDPDDWMRVADALLRYYMGIPDPDSLSDDEWARRYNELLYIRTKEAGQ